MFDVAAQLSADLEASGLDVLYDDRPKVSPGVKFGDAELVGVPWIVIVGRGAADGEVELWDRRTGDREVLSVADAVARLSVADAQIRVARAEEAEDAVGDEAHAHGADEQGTVREVEECVDRGIQGSPLRSDRP